MKTIAAFLLLALMLLPGETTAQLPYSNWDFTIRAATATQSDSLARMGIRPDATSDFENTYDVPRPPRSPSGPYVEVYFPHSGGSYPPLLGTRYATDFQGPVDPVWAFSVECSATGPLTLGWDSAYVNSIERRVQLFLVDQATGTRVDMRASGSYTFTYSTKRDFQVVGAVKIDLTCLMEGFWNGSTQVQDTVTGYLASAASPHGLLDSAKAVLNSAGNGLLVFPATATGNYYLVVRHRNHLGVWSASAPSMTKGTTTVGAYDFSTGPGTAWGSAALKQEGPLYVTWGGDVNQDGVIDFLDRNIAWNDRTATGYVAADCDGNGVTDSLDYSMVLSNRLKTEQQP